MKTKVSKENWVNKKVEKQELKAQNIHEDQEKGKEKRDENCQGGIERKRKEN